MGKSLATALLGLWASSASGDAPDCWSWPTNMAFVHLKNAGLTDNAKVDWDKITHTRIASERIGKDLYRQVYRVRFPEKTGKTIEVVTVSDASHQECSMSGVDVYVVERQLGGK